MPAFDFCATEVRVVYEFSDEFVSAVRIRLPSHHARFSGYSYVFTIRNVATIYYFYLFWMNYFERARSNAQCSARVRNRLFRYRFISEKLTKVFRDQLTRIAYFGLASLNFRR